MAERSFTILKYDGKVPAMAGCGKCQCKFFTPSKLLRVGLGAEQNLRGKFERHKCKEPGVSFRGPFHGRCPVCGTTSRRLGKHLRSAHPETFGPLPSLEPTKAALRTDSKLAPAPTIPHRVKANKKQKRRGKRWARIKVPSANVPSSMNWARGNNSRGTGMNTSANRTRRRMPPK